MQTHSFIYDDLAFDDSRRLAGRQATAAALARCKMRFGTFLAGNRDEIAVRYDFIEGDIRQVVADVTAEYGGNAEQIFDSVTTVLAAGGFCDDCRKWKSGPKAGCTCSGDSKATPESAGADIEEDEPDVAKEASRRMADKLTQSERDALPASDFADPKNRRYPVEDKTHAEKAEQFASGTKDEKHVDEKVHEKFPDMGKKADASNPTCDQCGKQMNPVDKMVGGTCLACSKKNQTEVTGGWHGEWRFVGEALKTETLPDPKFGTEPWGNGPSPKMDKTRWKPNALNDSGNLKPIDTDMKGTRHPIEHQDIGQIADHTKDFQDQTKAGEKEETLKGTDSFDDAGFNTKKNETQYPTRTFDDTHHQQKPVTNEVWPKRSMDLHDRPAQPHEMENQYIPSSEYPPDHRQYCPSCDLPHSGPGEMCEDCSRSSYQQGMQNLMQEPGVHMGAGFGGSADAYPTPSGQFRDAPNLDAHGNPGYGTQNDGDQPGNTGMDPNNSTCQNCGEDIFHHDENGMCPTDVHMPLDPSAQYPPNEGDPATHMQSPGFQQSGAVDPDKNPVLDLLSQEQIQQALAAYRPRPL